MEFADGQNLSERLQADSALPIRLAFRNSSPSLWVRLGEIGQEMAAPDEKIRIFVCYSHSDKIWVSSNSLIPWLQKNLERYHVEFWWDREESGAAMPGAKELQTRSTGPT
jgi:hypothetical protein